MTYPAVSPKLPIPAIGAKIFHYCNFISLLIMLTSGLQIYNANPVFGGRGGLRIFPLFTLGGWLAGGRNWHFAAMWLFSINVFCYGIYIVVTRRWKNRFVGANDIQALQRSQNHQRLNYAWHRIIYTAIIPILLLAIFVYFHWHLEQKVGGNALTQLKILTDGLRIFLSLNSQKR